MITDEQIEEHPFGFFVPANATILIIGSFPGKEQVKNKSNTEEWFYTAKGNLFWPILSLVYGVDLKTIVAKKKLFKKHGIGVTDIFFKVRRKENSNQDKFLEIKEYNNKAIESILKNSKIKTIYFTSKFVEKHFRKHFIEVTNTTCLPSPSGAANISISKTEDYKNYIIKNQTGNTKTFRISKYTELLKNRNGSD